MRYFYEYKYKKGNRMVGGHNLEKIEFFGNYIKLSGVDIIPTNYDYENPNDDVGHWQEEIKSVITHEQMEQMSYKIE